jgi:hypothetical protein
MNPSWMRTTCHFCALSVGVVALAFSSWTLMAIASLFALLAIAWGLSCKS